jgi:hypothetical protein
MMRTNHLFRDSIEPKITIGRLRDLRLNEPRDVTLPTS